MEDGVSIKLNDNWWIKSDEYQYILVEEKVVQSGENKGQKYLDTGNATYYRTIPHLIADHHHRLVRLCGAKTLRELQQAYNDTNLIIDELVRKLRVEV